MKILIDDVLIAGRIENLPGILGSYVLLVSAQILAGYALARDSALIAQIAKDVGIELYRYLISARPHSFHKRSVGDLLTPLSCDVEHIEHRRSQDPPRSRSRVGLQQ